MTEITTIGQLATATANELAAKGWCQGQHATPDGKVCLEGAVNAAAYDSPEPWERHAKTGENHRVLNFYNPATQALHEGFVKTGIIPKQFSPALNRDVTRSLWSWNDNSDRTPGEVKEALFRVAQECADIPCDLTLDQEAEELLK